MEILIALGVLVGVGYLLVGAILAWYESSQTDDPFSWKLMLKWPLRLMGKI